MKDDVFRPDPATVSANIRRLLAPRHIVFAGGERAAAAIRTCRQAGFTGQLWALHPKRNTIAGVLCYRSVADLPEAPDAAFIGVPAEATISLIDALAQRGAGGAVCYASGFAELGDIGRERNTRLVSAAGNMALVGPNCFGIINYVTDASLWSVPYPRQKVRRGAAVVGQSGNVCINLSMQQRHVPFSYIISSGNQAVLGFEQYIDALTDDPAVTAIGLFMEGIRDVAAFSAACLRARAKGLPVIAFRVGVSELGAQLAASHTSSLAGQNDLYDALFDRLGVISTDSVPQFLEMLKCAALWEQPRGNRLAVFSSSGGDNGMAADYCSAAGLSLPQLSPDQANAIQHHLPDFGHASNPLDFTAGYWGAEELLAAMFTEAMRENYDQALLVIDHPRPEVGPDAGKPLLAMVRALARAREATGIPAAVACVNPESMPAGMRASVIKQGLLPLQGLHDAGKVLGRWAAFCAMQARDREDGLPTAPFGAVGALDDTPTRALDEAESKRRLAAFGLPVPQGVVLKRDDLPSFDPGPDPVALKVCDAALPHKTDAGAVALGLRGKAEFQLAAARMLEAVDRARPELKPQRFLVEPMQPAPLAELLIGVKRDPMFGLVLVIATGGVLVELLRDSAQLLLPAGAAEIETALRSLRAFALLDGFRGRPKADLPALVEAIAAVARYAQSAPESLAELDVNPLFVFPEGQGVIAVDALIIEATH